MRSSSMPCGFTAPSFSGWTRGLSEKPIVSRNVMPASPAVVAAEIGSIAEPRHRKADRMADMALQPVLSEFASILPDPLGIDKLFAQFQEHEAGAAPRLDMLAEQMNGVGDRDRLAGRVVEMRRHPFQQHEGGVVDQDNPAIRTLERRPPG